MSQDQSSTSVQQKSHNSEDKKITINREYQYTEELIQCWKTFYNGWGYHMFFNFTSDVGGNPNYFLTPVDPESKESSEYKYNYIWSDPSCGGDNTIRPHMGLVKNYFNPYGRDKGTQCVRTFCKGAKFVPLKNKENNEDNCRECKIYY